jgi:hypothetical protein
MVSARTLASRSPHRPAGVSSLALNARQLLVLLSGIAVVALAMLLTTIPYGRSIWDYLFLLDGAYRISLGQVPHVDFSSPVGSLSLYLTFAAERLFPNGNPFVGLHALVWLLTLPAVAVLAPRFRSDLGFAAAFVLLAAMILIPVTLDSTHLSEISYFASYNRFASGLLFLLAYILALLFFLKITTAMVAGGIIVAAVILGRAQLRVLLAALIGAAVILVIANLPAGLVAAYLHDVRSMSAINQGRALYALFFAAFRNWGPLLAAAGIAVVALISFRQTAAASLRRPVEAVFAFLKQESFAVDACLLIAAALFAESQNTGGLGLIAAAAILFHPEAWKGSTARAVTAGLLLATLTLPLADIVIKRGMTEAVRTREAAADQSLSALIPGTRVPQSTAEGARLFERFTGDWLTLARDIQRAGFFIDPDPTSNASAVRLAWAKSAIEAGRAFTQNGYRTAANRFATLSFADPFARMLRLTPARGTTIAIEVGRTLPLLNEDGASHYLADADGVFVDRCQIGANVTNDAVFQTVLDREFEKLPLHRCWDFYRRPETSRQGRGS